MTSTLVFAKITSKKVKNGGGNLTDSQKLLELAKQNNSIIPTAMVVEAGISRGALKDLSAGGGLERASRGVYSLPEVWEDEFVNIQSRFKRGIFALETALFLCDLTDRTLRRYHMIFPATQTIWQKREIIVCHI